MFEDVEKSMREIHGWLDIEEAKYLYKTALTSLDKGMVVEIGAWKGKSTVCLGQAAKDKGVLDMVVTIDHFKGSPEHGNVWTFPEFQDNIIKAKVSDYINFIIGDSVSSAKDFFPTISFLFIDGNHAYENVRADFEAFYPNVKSGGLICFHDSCEISWEGPKRIVRELKTDRRVKHVGEFGSINTFEKI